MGIDILGIDILGVDILGIDIPAPGALPLHITIRPKIRICVFQVT